jgi:hypothetical protein
VLAGAHGEVDPVQYLDQPERLLDALQLDDRAAVPDISAREGRLGGHLHHLNCSLDVFA